MNVNLDQIENELKKRLTYPYKWHRRGVVVTHGLADTMRHEPRRLIRHA